MIVDPLKTYFSRLALPEDSPLKDTILTAIKDLLDKAVGEGRKPVVLEMIVRVAPVAVA